MAPNREDAWNLLTQYTSNTSLLKHALAVEAAMRAYARRFGEDEEVWGITGLIHDFDYEQHPTLDEHPAVGVSILQTLGWPDNIVYAVKSHGIDQDAPRIHPIDKTLYAVDELSGLVIACAMVRPDKSLGNLQVNSVRKKWKDKAFARGVNRGDIEAGASELGVELDEHIDIVIRALRTIAPALDLS
ncbi:MAG: HDIG domain-containing protein [Chloroflexi bacterium]|nr:HDIG domain-containing protein [Chloroflexota bacterium]